MAMLFLLFALPIPAMLFSLLGRFSYVFLRGEPSFYLKRRHAAHAGGGDGLAIDIVRHIARRINALNGGRGRAAIGDDVAADALSGS